MQNLDYICIMANWIMNTTDEMFPEELKFVSDLKAIVYRAKAKAYQAADLFNVAANWLVGQRIVEQEQNGHERAEYGKQIIQLASKALTEEFGKGYSETQIRDFRKFYLIFSDLQIQRTVSANFKSIDHNATVSFGMAIQQTPSAELELAKILPVNLSWSHYESLKTAGRFMQQNT